MSDVHQPDDKQPTFREALRDAARNSGLGKVAPGEAPSKGALLSAVGGVRGIIESVLPVLGFTVVYTITKNVPLAVAIPVGLSVVFVLVRLITRTPMSSAVVGLVLVGISAVLALLTGEGRSNFVPGFLINGALLAVLVVSLIARRPLIGVIASLITGDEDWRRDARKYRTAVIATLLWIALFGARLAVEVPLYFANLTEALGVARLITGVPLYAIVLWVTWLLVRTVYARPHPE
ncbi:MAG: DUF3159 domain-containing protein [Rhodoglobus sp.]